MKIYNISFVNKRINDLSNTSINKELEEYINLLSNNDNINYTNSINVDKKPSKNFSNKYNNKYRNKSNNIHTNNYENYSNKNYDIYNCYNIERAKNNNNKSDLELDINNIKKIFNKITASTFDKLKSEFLCLYIILLNKYQNNTNNTNNTNTDLLKIDEYIINYILYNSSFFSELFLDLLYNLINIRINFSNLLNNNINILYNIFDFIQIKSDNDNDDNDLNKNNDKYKSCLIFYINCINKKIIPFDIILNIIEIYQDKLIEIIKLNDKKLFAEKIMEFYSLIFQYINIEQLKEYKNSKIFENILFFKTINIKDYPSLTNKIKFKNMDIFDMMKKNNLLSIS